MTDIADKENSLEGLNTSTPQKGRQDFIKLPLSRPSSLLFLSNLEDSPGSSDDEEISFKPSAKRVEPRRKGFEISIKRPGLDVSPILEDKTSTPPQTLEDHQIPKVSIDAQVLTESASRFEQVSARLDQWKKAMAGFSLSSAPCSAASSPIELQPTLSSPNTLLDMTENHEPASLHQADEPQLPAASGTLVSPVPEVEPDSSGNELLLDFSAEPSKPRKRPTFVPGRHSKQLQEARALKKVLAAQESTDIPSASTECPAAPCEEVFVNKDRETKATPADELVCPPASNPPDDILAALHDVSTSNPFVHSEVLDPSLSLHITPQEDHDVCTAVFHANKHELIMPTDQKPDASLDEILSTPFLEDCSILATPLITDVPNSGGNTVIATPKKEGFSSYPQSASDEFCIPCTPTSEKVQTKLEVDTEEVAALKERLASLTNANRHLENVIRGYEETFEQLVKEEQQKFEEEQRLRMALQEKNKELLEDMGDITKSFEQMKMRYEEYKTNNEVLQRQLDGVRQAAEDTEGALREAEAGQEAWAARFDALKLHAQERLAAANAEIEALQQAAREREDSLSLLRNREESLVLSHRKQLAAWDGRSRLAQSRIAALEQERNELLLICEQLMSSLESPPPLSSLEQTVL